MDNNSNMERQQKTVEEKLKEYEDYLIREEKAPATREKYLRDVQGFLIYCEDKEKQETFSMEDVIAYKQKLTEEDISQSTVNGKLAAIRSYLRYEGREDIHVKNIRYQRSPYVSEKRMLEKSEYNRLLDQATRTGQFKLKLILESICSTGIRVSELSYITVEAIEKGESEVSLKGKTRKILIPAKLRKKLIKYARSSGIQKGPVFINSKGEPVHRSCVWAMMKSLAARAGVDISKAFPHNLRRLFARTFYRAKKDIAKLADVLGHSRIDTTRIYIAESFREHAKLIEELDLVT